MSKLIVAKDILACEEAGQKICYIEKGTIITPAAQDEAKKYNISFEYCNKCEKMTSGLNEQRISTDEILHILKNILMNASDQSEKSETVSLCLAYEWDEDCPWINSSHG